MSVCEGVQVQSDTTDDTVTVFGRDGGGVVLVVFDAETGRAVEASIDDEAVADLIAAIQEKAEA